MVSAEDKHLLEHRWSPSINSAGYVCLVRRVTIGPRRRKGLVLAREVLNAPDHLEADHRSHDTLDNRRSNLRLATPSENSRNRRYRGGKAGKKGVFERNGRFYAEVKVHGRRHPLGDFATPSEAHEAYRAGAARLHGEFARFE